MGLCCQPTTNVLPRASTAWTIGTSARTKQVSSRTETYIPTTVAVSTTLQTVRMQVSLARGHAQALRHGRLRADVSMKPVVVESNMTAATGQQLCWQQLCACMQTLVTSLMQAVRMMPP